MARVSQLFDVLNKITVDAIICPKSTGERELAAIFAPSLSPHDPVETALYDQLKPPAWKDGGSDKNILGTDDLGRDILSRIIYGARISCTKWKTVRSFFYSGLAEKIICLPIHATSVVQRKEMGLDMKPLKLRLIRIQDWDKVQVLITSLTDAKRYPIDIFHDLYLNRWPIEEDYKSIKCRMELENFSGKSALSVYQDFHAKIFAKNLVSIMAFPVNDSLKNNSEHRNMTIKSILPKCFQRAKVSSHYFFTKPNQNLCSL